MSNLVLGNLFDGATPAEHGERFDALLQHRNLVVERIVSSADITPVEYVQAQDEWVVLLRGDAEVEVEVRGDAVRLRAGDHLFLPAGTPHRVTRASAGALWLAVHLYPGHPGPGPAVP